MTLCIQLGLFGKEAQQYGPYIRMALADGMNNVKLFQSSKKIIK